MVTCHLRRSCQFFRAEACPPFPRLYLNHHPYLLNEAIMAGFSPLLGGERDFSAFASTDEADELALGQGRTKFRRIFSATIERTGDLLLYRVRAAASSNTLARNIVGVLMEAGKENLDRAAFEALSPDAESPPAPPPRLADSSC
jgi:tRNA U38,U39,U40 pseudouridine synthase TruA